LCATKEQVCIVGPCIRILSAPVLSGGATADPDPAAGTDVNFFVSGSAGSKDGLVGGTSVFGGDMVVSGVMYAPTGLSGGPTGNLFLTGADIYLTAGERDIYFRGGDGTIGLRLQMSGDAGDMDAVFKQQGGVEVFRIDSSQNSLKMATSRKIHFGSFNEYIYGNGTDLTVASNNNLNLAATTQVLILSGGAAASPDESSYTDINFFVSGAIGSRNSAVKGTAIFGGDLHVSGNLSVDGTGLSGGAGNIGWATGSAGFLVGGGAGPAGWISTTGSLAISGSVLDVSAYVRHVGDTTTSIYFTDDRIALQADDGTGSEYALIALDGTPAAGVPNIMVNGSGRDFDFGVIGRSSEANILLSGTYGSAQYPNAGTNDTNLFLSGTQVLILSGGAGVSADVASFTDTNFFVSGTLGSKDSAVAGTSLFGGDLVVSGTLVANRSDDGALKIDKDYTGTTTVGNYTTDASGLLIDYDVTGIVGTGQTAIHDALAINYNQDSPTMVGTIEATGADIRMTGGTSGTQSMKGVAITLAGADTHVGVDVTAPNDSTHFIARSSDHILDQFKISVGEAGATTLSTNDFHATLAHLNLDADGALNLDGASGINIGTGGSVAVDLNADTLDIDALLAVTIDSLGGTIGIGTNDNDFNISIGTQGGRVIALGSTDAGIDIDAGTAGIALDSTAAISLDAATASNFKSSGGVLTLESGKTGAGALLLSASHAAGGVRIDAGTGNMVLNSDDQVLILSGGAAASPNSAAAASTNFFVSGSIGSKENSVRGTSVFGGDTVVSGTLLVGGSDFLAMGTHGGTISGSIHHTSGGVSYLIAGSNVTITSASNGQVTIASSGGGTPGGSDTQVQFNDGGSFGGDGDFNFNSSKLGVTGSATRLNAALELKKSFSATTDMTATPGDVFPKGLKVDYDVTAGPDGLGEFAYHNAIQVDYNQDSAALHGGAVLQGKGISIDMAAGTDGIQTLVGAEITVAGGTAGAADANYGIVVTAPPAYVNGALSTVNMAHIRCRSDADNSDYFNISVGDDGLTTLSTLDSAAANAHLNIIPDGKMLILSGGAARSPNETFHADINFFVSGSAASRNSASVAGTSVFGGDVVASGSLYVGSGSAAGHTAFSAVHSYDPGSGDSFENQLGNNEAGGRIIHFGSGSLNAGNLYYLHTDATWTQADADAASSGATQLLGIPLGASATKHGVLLEGFARIFNMKVTGAPSIGAPVYVDTTAGRVALTKPSGSGHFVRVIGYCVDFNADGDILLYFNPDATSIELS